MRNCGPLTAEAIPPGLQLSQDGEEDTQPSATAPPKKLKIRPFVQDLNRLPGGVLEDDMEANDVASNAEETSTVIYSTSGPVMTMPGVTHLPNLFEINAQFSLNHAAYYIDSLAQIRQSPAMKQCPNPSYARQYNRNQHGFTIHCARCKCRLLFAKQFDVMMDHTGNATLAQSVWTGDRVTAGTSSQQRFALRSLQRMKAQNQESRSLQLALLQRAVQAEQPVLPAPRAGRSNSEQAIVEALRIVLATISQQLQAHQAQILEALHDFSTSLQNCQREMVAKLSELNQDNLTKVLMALAGAKRISQNG